ncbi:hypothetical protein C8J56DRAFT_1165422, partial [Mycena floridula]
MQLVFALVTLLPFAAALVPPLEERAAQQQGSVFVTVDTQFAGANIKVTGSSGQCVNMPTGWNDVISSVGPDPGQDCFFFADINCTGDTIGPIRSPGIPDLRQTTPDMNDRITSQ